MNKSIYDNSQIMEKTRAFMSKHNGSRTGREKEKHFERRRVSDPTEIQRNGISILAVGPDTGEKPDEIQMIWHVPGAPHASRLTFKEPMLGSER